MRISDWSSDVCSSDLIIVIAAEESDAKARYIHRPPLRSESAEGQERRWRKGKPLPLPIAKGVLSWRNCLCALKRCWSGFQHLFAVTKRARWEERRVGKEWASTCRAGWSPGQ